MWALAGRSRGAWFPLLVLAIVVTGVALRLRIAASDLQSPLIDENEVVEQAVAFMGGDLRQHFVKYGPLTMYVLAGLYHAVAALRGLSPLDYASLAFFHGEQHYFIARALTGLAISGLAVAAFFTFRRSAGSAAALVAGTLLALPCVDVVVNGARIDMLQAAFQGLALLALGEASDTTPRRRYWLAAGAAAGLAIASKPLPGLLVLPCFPVASWFAARETSAGERRPFLPRLAAALLRPGLWLAALACIGMALLADPAILNLREFIALQRAAAALHSGPLSAGPSIFDTFALLGLPFCAAMLLSFALVVARGDARGRLVALFCVIYLGVFWGRSRHYFLVAAAAAACLLIGHGVAVAGQLAARASARTTFRLRAALVALVFLIGAAPLITLETRLARTSPRTQARDWIHTHVPSGTPLYYVGWRGAGPALVAQSAAIQAEFGDHFGYQRQKYAFLKQAFARGYDDYVRAGLPRYPIAFHHDKPSSRKSKLTPRSITDSLLEKARAQGRRYIIVAGYTEPDVQALGYRWFSDAVLEQQFGKIAIFRVPDAPRATP
jgi:hypothetical protein